MANGIYEAYRAPQQGLQSARTGQPQPPRSAAPQPGYAPQGHAPQDYAPHDYAPHDYAPQDYAPREYPPQAYAPQGYAQPAPAPQPPRQAYAPQPAYAPQGYAPAHDPAPEYAPGYPQQAYADPGYDPFPDAAYGQPYAEPAPAQAPPPQHPRASQAAPAGAGASRLVSLTGAALSVALVMGVGVWSYRLMVRDVSGVPVIRAMAGPIRVSPEDPGGRQAAYQGLAVNTVAAEGGAASAAQSVALAPPPIELTDEDRSAAALAAAGQNTAAAPITAPAAITVPLTPAESAPVTLAAAAASSAAPLTILPASVPGLSRSPLPRSRPAAVRNAAPVATPAPVTAVASAATPGADPEAEALLQELVTRLGSSAPAVSEIDPTTLPAGTRLVQLGAYDSADEARSAWNGLASRFPAYLEGRGRIVEAASAGGRTFYRLRAAGFQDEPEARRFCAVFLGENVDCIPVLVR